MRLTSIGAIPPAAPILLDTHIWVWHAQGAGERTSRETPSLVDRAAGDGRLFASAASVWEIALKAERGDLLVGTDLRSWLEEQQDAPGIRLLSITPTLAIDVTQMPAWIRRRDGLPHRDPNDRFIVATARKRGAVLVTVDAAILEYAEDGHVVAYDARP